MEPLKLTLKQAFAKNCFIRFRLISIRFQLVQQVYVSLLRRRNLSLGARSGLMKPVFLSLLMMALQ
jgi:hypothetical protein